MKRTALALLFFCLSSSMMLAQTQPATGEGGVNSGVGITGSFVAVTGDHGLGAYGGQIVKEKPFCADTEDESVRTLASGNHIRSLMKGRECRDSQGRTYFEREIGPGLPQVSNIRTIHITDPLSGTIIMLEPRSKTANMISTSHMESDVRRLQAARTNAPEAPVKVERKLMPARGSEDLGEKEIEGVLAHGIRSTTTYPAGSRGNEEPLKDSYETWTATDLKVNVLMISTSEERGVTTHRMKNLQRVEPDPLIFQVPPDYTVQKN
jgi:hypothetical protein